jgi:leucyl aminopeptidase
MLPCFAPAGASARPVTVVGAGSYADWLAGAEPRWRSWLEASGFKAKGGAVSLLPGADGTLERALLVVSDPPEPWDVAALQAALPFGAWRIEDPAGLLPPGHAALGWALAAYRFTRYRADDNQRPLLVLPEGAGVRRAGTVAEATWLARDLVNTPANDLGPEQLAAAIEGVAGRFGAACKVIVVDELLQANYPAVHAVGRASARSPRLIDVTWGDAAAPRLTLVGKGVCFDTGGLDIKPSSNMLLMKKDMGGAAVMLALAQCVMALGLRVRLRLLVPAVENSIGGAAFRPGDVLRMRNGSTVEITNTDAEGRLVLADALAEADGERPDLLLDAATLTGAARVAVGPELPALFTPDEGVAEALLRQGTSQFEPLWRLPLHAPYLRYMKSPVADLVNASSKAFAGAITAALFLKEFVKETSAWAHLDLFAWNDEALPGRPRGGEATALRPLLALVEERFGRGDA